MVSFFSKSSSEVPAPFRNFDSERQQRLENYKLAWQAYNAELPDPLVTDSAANDNVKVNPARAIVNTSVYFLFGKEIKFEVSPERSEQYSEEDREEGTPGELTPEWLRALNRAWKANRKQSFLNRMGLSGAIHGNVFIKFEPRGAGTTNQYPRLILLDPANVEVQWDPNDCEKIVSFSIEYVTQNDEGRPTLEIQRITPNDDQYGVAESWTLQNYKHEMTWGDGGWFPGTGGLEPVGEPILWPFSWPPVEHCQNLEIPNQVWGMPDLDETTVEVIQSLQRAMSSVNKIVRVHGSPRLFAKNVLPEQVNEIDVSPDNIITLPSSEADLKVLEMLSNLNSSIDFTDKIREDLYEMLQVPPIALGKASTSSMSMSGASLSILYAPILQKTDLKRISYGDMIDRVNHKLLVLMGYTDEEEYEGLVTVWPESMPGSKYLERQTLQQDRQMGLSAYTTLQRLGYDPKLEEDRRETEREAEREVSPGSGLPGQPKDYTPNPDGPKMYTNQNGSAGATGNSTPKTPSEE